MPLNELPRMNREAICKLMQRVVDCTSDQERTLLCSTATGYFSALLDADIVDEQVHKGLSNWLLVLSKPKTMEISGGQLRDDLAKLIPLEKNTSHRNVRAFTIPSILIGLICLCLGSYHWFFPVLGVVTFANELFFCYMIHRRKNAPAR